MNKNELAARMVKDSSITKTEAQKVIDLFVDIITDELKKTNGKITLVGFGTFKTLDKKERTGRNPRTGAEIRIPGKRVVKFIPGKKLKDSVN